MTDQEKTITLKSNDDDLLALVELAAAGYKLLCPICKEEVWVIDTPEKMAKYHSTRGAKCSRNPDHYGFYLVEKRKGDFLRDLPKNKN
ncbi:hypothetical protein GCM10007907_30320 [Chitinimonas prasina]|uniref:Uncharacterized protein n=1 Tax=Chitinimonas prasina TaxID=1434937 RepID=A0ABQ5YIA3_9NEIS|nr:hypothetical protein [Chitinimonas prasina]GLR14242.1 hypothetical protein GCM10007907_30320 [Chitinimonas prasina]